MVTALGAQAAALGSWRTALETRIRQLCRSGFAAWLSHPCVEQPRNLHSVAQPLSANTSRDVAQP
jgi:hypothetical protein